MRNRTPILCLLLVLLTAGALLAGTEGRLKGLVLDAEGNPVAEAQVTLMAQDVAAVRQTETKKNGKFVLIVGDATRDYMIRIEKQGFLTIQEPIKLTIGGQDAREWTLREGESAAGAAVVEVHAPGAKIYNEGARAFNQGDIDGALAKFEEAAVENPELPEAWQGQAMIHWSRENTAEAVAAAERVVALDPSNVLAQRIRYDGYLELGDERAAAALEELAAVDRTPGTARRIFNIGVSAVRANDYEEAVARFRQAIEIDPQLAQGYEVLGKLYNTRKLHAEAIAQAEKLLELEPGAPAAHAILYEAYRSTGETEKAEASWAVLKQANPRELAQALTEEGESLFNAGQAAAAKGRLEMALEALPDFPPALFTLGLCQLSLGEQAAAREHLQRFLELAPDHPEAGTAAEMLAALE